MRVRTTYAPNDCRDGKNRHETQLFNEEVPFHGWNRPRLLYGTKAAVFLKSSGAPLGASGVCS